MIHPSSDVQASDIGEGTSIWQFCVVLPRARIGRNCNVNCGVFIENDVIIGDDVTIKCGVQLWDGIRIGNGAFIGPNVTFTNDRLPRSKRYPASFEGATLGDGASIGANSTIIGGIRIGDHAMIGAGSVVTRDVPPYSLWYGNPAKPKGFVCGCGEKLGESLTCSVCGKRFIATREGVSPI
jgi:UDP-2-acetamido-3-amino-2,3-dideoxy-glucuronate N-acetyltransferase